MAVLLWYVARLKRPAIALKGLIDQGFEVYYPQIIVRAVKASRITERREAVFYGYAFVLCEPEPEAWRCINYTRGVIKMLGSGQDGTPIPLPNGEIDRLKECENSGLLRHSWQRIKQGDSVAFRYGPLAEQIGICSWVKRERVGVLLSFLGSVREVAVARDWLRAVPQASGSAEAIAV